MSTASERTNLGWQRTGLSVLAVTALVGRYRIGSDGAWGLVPLAIVVPVVVWLFVVGTLRHDDGGYDRELRRDARVPLALTLVVCALAVGELVLALA